MTRLMMLLVLLPVTAFAQEAAPTPLCAPSTKFLETLEARYGEKPAIVLTTKIGSVLVMTLNLELATWTLLGQSTDGSTMCLINAGENFTETKFLAPWSGI